VLRWLRGGNAERGEDEDGTYGGRKDGWDEIGTGVVEMRYGARRRGGRGGKERERRCVGGEGAGWMEGEDEEGDGRGKRLMVAWRT
jgi:hypothetical protein